MERMTPILILFGFLFILLLPDIYIWFVHLRNAAVVWRVLWWLPTLAVLVTLFLFVHQGASPSLLSVFTGLVLCMVLPKLLFAVFSLFGQLIGMAWPLASRVGKGLGLFTSVVLALAMIYGWQFGWKNLSVKQVELSFDNLPAEFDGYKIVQLSDLHIGTYRNNPAFLEKLVQRVNNEKADLIVFTGDLINTSSEEIAPFEQLLSSMQAKDGVLSVLGNHDYCIYAMSRQRPANFREATKPVIEAERRMGWDLLLNDHRMVSRGAAQIALVGVENTGKPPFPEIGDLKGAIAGIPEGTFIILLSHDPSHWRMEVLPETDIPLTLSGHTHAAQVKFGKWSPSKWLYSEWGGLYNECNQRLYVSEGIGGSIPFRLGTKPEIVVFTLRTKSA